MGRCRVRGERLVVDEGIGVDGRNADWGSGAVNRESTRTEGGGWERRAVAAELLKGGSWTEGAEVGDELVELLVGEEGGVGGHGGGVALDHLR